MPGDVQRIEACLNGRRSRADHPRVPVTPAQLAEEAAAAVAAGAEAIHLHARDAAGAESLLASDVGAAVGAVRGVCPDTTVGVSTALWITGGDVAAQRSSVAGWAALAEASRPDFASVNLNEPGAAAVLAALDAAGIAAEAGVWSVADVPGAVRLSPATGWLRIMLEIIGATAAAAVGQADDILRELDAAGATAPLLLHGEDETCWPLVRRAGQLGIATRIGLEDVTTGPAGEPVSGNADLVSHALGIWATAQPRP